jgi:hypothetical protein
LPSCVGQGSTDREYICKGSGRLDSIDIQIHPVAVERDQAMDDDVESGMAAVVAEPDNCGRCRVTFLMGVGMLSFVVLGYYLVGPKYFEFEVEKKRPDNTCSSSSPGSYMPRRRYLFLHPPRKPSAGVGRWPSRGAQICR